MKSFSKLFRRVFIAPLIVFAVIGLPMLQIEEEPVVQDNVTLEAQKLPKESATFNQSKDEEIENLHNQLIKQRKQKMAQKLQNIKSRAKWNDPSKRITILMYHYVDTDPTNEMKVPKEKFREQMKYLKDSGFTVLSLDEIYSHYMEGKKIPDKCIAVTFDDGYMDNYTNAYPVLKEFGFKATIFMIGSKINTPRHLTSEQIKELDKNGISIEGHTVNHPRLSELPYYKQYEELSVSKNTLEEILGRKVKYIAYPYGDYDDDTILAAHELGYKMALATTRGQAHKSNGIYELHRVSISSKYDLDYFKYLVNMKNW